MPAGTSAPRVMASSTSYSPRTFSASSETSRSSSSQLTISRAGVATVIRRLAGSAVGVAPCVDAIRRLLPARVRFADRRRIGGQVGPQPDEGGGGWRQLDRCRLGELGQVLQRQRLARGVEALDDGERLTEGV